MELEDLFGIIEVICLIVIATCIFYIGYVIEDINDKLTPNCITVEDKVYCERGE